MRANTAFVHVVFLMLMLNIACCRAATAEDDVPSQSRGITALLNYHDLVEFDREQQAQLHPLKAPEPFNTSETLDAIVSRRDITVSHEPPTWPQRPIDFAPNFTGTIRIELHLHDDPCMKPLKVTQVEPEPHFWEQLPVGDLHRLDSVLWAW